MKVIEMLAPVVSTGARSGLKRTGFLGVTVHNTGNKSKGADAKNHGTYLQNSGKSKQVSWHYAVDEDCAVRSIPESEIAWHGGDGGTGNGNCKTIAIEICMNEDGNLLKATDNGAKLTADILKRNGHTKAVSGKNVFQHNHWNGKNCPQMIRAGKPYSWSKFIDKVNAYLGVEEKSSAKSTTKTDAKKQTSMGIEKGDKVTLSSKATVYQGASKGVEIPSEVKGKKYTVQKVSSDGKRLLLQEIVSWVLASECSKTGKTTSKKKTLSVGMKATPKKALSYEGVKMIPEVTKKKFTVIQIKGKRVVLGDGLNTAFHIDNLSY